MLSGCFVSSTQCTVCNYETAEHSLIFIMGTGRDLDPQKLETTRKDSQSINKFALHHRIEQSPFMHCKYTKKSEYVFILSYFFSCALPGSEQVIQSIMLLGNSLLRKLDILQLHSISSACSILPNKIIVTLALANQIKSNQMVLYQVHR